MAWAPTRSQLSLPKEFLLFGAVAVGMSYMAKNNPPTYNHHAAPVVFFSSILHALFHTPLPWWYLKGMIRCPSKIPSDLLKVLTPGAVDITTIQSPEPKFCVIFCLLVPKEALFELRVHEVFYQKDFQTFHFSLLWPRPGKQLPAPNPVRVDGNSLPAQSCSSSSTLPTSQSSLIAMCLALRTGKPRR